MSDEKHESPLERAERKRAERKAKLKEQEDAQRARDLEVVDALEEEHGDSKIAVLNVPYTPGLPTLVAARLPTDPEIKRYRYRCKDKGPKEPGDAIGAAEELSAKTRVYPDDETYAKICAERHGVPLQLGIISANLAIGKAEAEGKG